MRRLVAFAVAFLLLVTMALPTGAAAAAPVVPQITGADIVSPAAKVAAELKDAFAKDEYVSYMVLLREQADPDKAASAAKADLLSSQAASAELTARVGVIRTLKETADRAQSGLLSILDSAKGKGLVKSVQSFYIINAMEITSTKEIMEAIAARPEVERLWPNTARQLIDPIVPASGEDAVGPTSIEWNIDKIGAPETWGLGIDGTGMVVANLDTGVDRTHPALQRKWRGFDPATGQPGPLATYSWFDAVNGQSLPYDDHAHGTHTMGTMVGSDPEGVNQIGVAPGAQWIAVKILNSAGQGYDDDILAGAQWLLAPGGDPAMAPDAVNNSWGGAPGLDEWFRPAVQAWRAAGIFPEFAAGNSGPGVGSVTAPGNYPEAVTVGMINSSDQLDSQSGRGPSPYAAPDDMKPDLTAPGVNIRSSVPGGGYQGGWGGTSMASPHVTASAVLVKQANPSLTVDQIEQVLKDTAYPLTDSQYTTVPSYGFGWGRVNVFDAVSEILTGRGEVTGRVLTGGDDLEPPVVSHTPVTLAFEGFDVPLTVEASDNVSIVSVEAYVRPVGASNYTYIPLQLTSGDYKSGTYVGNAPWYLFDSDYDAEYYIRVNDYGNNTYTSPVYPVDVQLGITAGYTQDFETAPMGWWHGAMGTSPDPWQWGVPTSGPNAAHSGTKVYATNLSGPYANNTQAYLMAPPIDLTAGGPAKLGFWHWYDLESGFDYGRVYVSTDGQNFTAVKTFNGLSGGWVRDTVDLTLYTGQVVYAMFMLQTDGSVAKQGWYIDDVFLIGPDTIAPAAPANLQAQLNPNGEPSLTWSPVDELDVTGYKVYRSITSGAGYTLIGTALTTQFVDANPVNNVANYYVVTAVDMGNNESPYSNEVSATPSLPVTAYFTDFEAGEAGWTHGGAGDVWQLGTPTSGPNAAHSGVNLWATNLGGQYGYSANCWLQSPVIDLTTYASAGLSFWHWYEIETNYDKGYVEISRDGGATWTQLAMYSHSTNGKVWAQPVLDLTPYVGAPVTLRFRLTSDSSVNKLGWYIDDVKVMGVQVVGSSLEPAFEPTDKKESEYPNPTPDWSKVRSDIKADSTQVITPSALPALATVTVLETGTSTRTNPATGAYTLKHAAGQYTLRAEAYGYYPADKAISIVDDGTTTANFYLEAIPQGTLTGLVYDKRTEQPVVGAEVYLREDARVLPVTTDASGQYVLNGLVGDYTLHVSAPGYYSADVSVTIAANSTTQYNVPLRPFIGYPGELAYDDGTATNAYTMNSAGNGFGVRFSPGSGTALLNTVSFLFWDATWPSPGGTAFQYAIYDVNPDGTPGARLAGPFNGTAIRNSNVWTTIDVSGLGLAVDGDFVVVEIQPNIGGNSPGMSVDEDTQDSGRNLAYVGGGWADWIEAGGTGNIMIRASVLYPVGVPMITSPTNGACVNTPDITVTGSASPYMSVNVYLGGALATTVTAGADGKFTAPVTISEGSNIITVDASVNGKYTDPSAPVEVILDMVNPTLTVSPADGFITNQSAIVLVVNGADEHLGDTITVASGSTAPVPVKNSGTTEWRVPVELAEGANTFTVTVFDRAGNSASTTLTLTRDSVAPVLTNLVPATDVTVAGGQTVTFAFDSEPGLTASYLVSVPSFSVNGYTAMTETAPGHYEAVWTAPTGIALNGAEVLFRAIDPAGNLTEATAVGKIAVTADEPVIEDLTLTPEPGAYTTNGNDAYATGKKFHISGQVSPAITSVKIGKTRMNISGGAFTYDYALSEGANRIVVTATKADRTTITKEYTVTLDSTCPVRPLSASQVTGDYLHVTGKTDPQAQVVVEVKSGNTVVDTITVTAGSDGAFLASNTVAIPAGRYTIVATATDPLGNTGTANTSVTLKKAAPAPAQ